VDAANPRVILRDATRQAGYGAIALIIFIVFALKAQISRVFLGSFIGGSWLLLIAFRLGARNLIPAVSRRFCSSRYVLIVGLGERARRLARNLEEYYGQGLRIVGFLAPPAEGPAPEVIELRNRYEVFALANLRAMLAQHVIDEIHFAVDSD